MALSGYEITDVGPYNELTLKWTATQNATNNTSTVTAILYWGATRSGVGPVTSGNARECVVSITGTSSTLNVNPSLAAGQTKEVNRFTKTVAHDAQGRLSLGIYSRFDIMVTLSGTYYGSVRADTTAYLNSIAVNTMKVWNGSAWVTGTPKVWNGSAWVAVKEIYTWDGSVWKK